MEQCSFWCYDEFCVSLSSGKLTFIRKTLRFGGWPGGVLEAKGALVLVLDLIHMSRRPPSMNMPVRFLTLNFTAPFLEAVKHVAVRPARPSPAARTYKGRHMASAYMNVQPHVQLRLASCMACTTYMRAHAGGSKQTAAELVSTHKGVLCLVRHPAPS